MPAYEFKCTKFVDCPTDEVRLSFQDFDKLKDLQICSCCSGAMIPVITAVPTVFARGDSDVRHSIKKFGMGNRTEI